MKWAVALLALAAASRCTRGDRNGGPAPSANPAGVVGPAVGAPPLANTEDPVADTLIARLPQCDVDHDGVFLDLGAPDIESRRDHRIGPFDDTPTYERAGATFARLHSRRIAYDFSTIEPIEHVVVSVKGLGVASRFANVYLDERRLGAVTLPRDEPSVVSTPSIDELPPGMHTVTLRFVGSAQGADEPYAELDWLRIGSADASHASYAPPTLRDIVTDVVLDGEPRRAVVLRSPSTVRCAVRVAPGTKLQLLAGYWGNGHGVATIRVVEDGVHPVVVAERKVNGGTGAVWSPVTVDLGPYAGRVVALELTAADSSGGGRVAFGEPMLVPGKPDQHEHVAPAQVVVVVVMAGLDRRMIPPWGPIGGFTALGRLSRDGVAFDRYRSPTTVVSAVMASLLSGLSPRAHGLETPTTRLDEDVRLIGDRAKEGSASAAFFTGVPMTFPVFGFDRGWDRSDSFSPVKDLPATEPISAGLAWLKESLASDHDAKLLLVVHARGGHPPWDVTKDEVAQLPPDEYTGPLEPRAGAIVLSNLRAQRGPADQRLSGNDWRRLRALEDAALKKQDAELRRLLDWLEGEHLYDKALVAVLGDVATGDPPNVPFAPSAPLREDVLLAPLIVKFPGNALGGVRAEAMATTVDLTDTVIRSLGLTADHTEGQDLFRLARNEGPVDGRALVATLGGRYATRYGPWLLSGEIGRRPTLCFIDVDPACANDAFSQSPLAAQALWQKTFDAETSAIAARPPSLHGPIAVVLDGDTESALRVFGY
ncbi:MAG TPA: sulfatase-like hydrolase/transferase [Polyangiaceae bacterium]|nr:sulfatase-like hydrolase/transferase [Polyangiaceae bacterium]